jgi:hypothetical protein
MDEVLQKIESLMRLIIWVLIPAIVVATIVALIKRDTRTSQSTAVDSAARNNPAQLARDGGVSATTMRFQTFTLQDDPSRVCGEVSRMLIPVGWKTQGGMAYNFNCFYPA